VLRDHLRNRGRIAPRRIRHVVILLLPEIRNYEQSIRLNKRSQPMPRLVLVDGTPRDNGWVFLKTEMSLMSLEGLSTTADSGTFSFHMVAWSLAMAHRTTRFGSQCRLRWSSLASYTSAYRTGW